MTKSKPKRHVNILLLAMQFW